MLVKEAFDTQRKHPLVFLAADGGAACPVEGGITNLAMLMKHRFPEPTQPSIFTGAVFFIPAIPPLMVSGACGWLLIARRLVPSDTAKDFFVHPGRGVLSRIDAWMLHCVYGRGGERLLGDAMHRSAVRQISLLAVT